MLGVIVSVPTTVYGFEISRLRFAGTGWRKATSIVPSKCDPKLESFLVYL